MKEKIRTILEDNLPLADLDSDFLFAELSSLDITTIMMLLSDEYHITLIASLLWYRENLKRRSK